MTTVTVSQSPSRKRKTLHDYFATSQASPPSKQAKPSPPTTVQPPSPPPPQTSPTNSLQSQSQSLPPGLSLHPNFLTPTEEDHLLTFLSTQPWRTDLSRRTIHYGGTYCLMPPRTATPTERARIESQIITALPLPHELDFLIARLIEHGLYTEATKPAYCIVNEYRAGQGISAHVENFRFSEPVCAVTLSAGDTMRFHELEGEDDGSVRSGRVGKARRTGRKRDVWLERRGLVVMKGEARRRWQHEIVRGRVRGRGEGWRRVSLTFRTDVKVPP